MSDHDRALDLAARAIDGELTPAEEAELDAHLAACETCRLVAAALRDDDAAIRALPALEPSAGLRDRILAATTPADPTADDVAPAPSPAAADDRPGGRVIAFPRRYREPLLVATAAAVAVAVIAGSFLWRGGRPDPTDVAVGSPTPIGSGPLPSLDPIRPIAELTARAGSGVVVPLDAGFTLTSLSGESAEDLAARLSVEPQVELTVAPAADGSVTITPAEPLEPGAVYRFTLSAPTGETVDSWAFQAEQPVRIVETIPGDESSDVPLDSGIELIFDQDGVADLTPHFSITPEVAGRFEQRDRTVVFLPTTPLAPKTIYTVTVSAGVEIEGTGEAMAADHVFRFETASAGSEPGEDEITFGFQESLLESPTGDSPRVGLWGFDGSDEPGPDTVRIDVYAFPDLAAAIEGYRTIRTFPSWTRWSRDGLVATDGLSRVVSVDTRLNDHRGGALWFELPDPLPAGWYLVQQPGGTRPTQAILQVTDLSGYLAVSTSQLVVWAHDLRTGDALAGVAASAVGTDLGATDAQGLLLAPTPAALVPPDDEPCPACPGQVVTIRDGAGRSAFLPASREPGKYDGYDSIGGSAFSDGDPRWWRLVESDRYTYRRTDTMNVWGAIRDRDSGAVPSAVEIDLAADSGDGGDQTPIGSITLEPGPTGLFAGAMPLTDLPEGFYTVTLRVDGSPVRSFTIEVAEILKPAYRLDVETGRRIYVNGDRIRVTATAAFFEGTPVPGIPLQLTGTFEDLVTTDATGTAIYRGTIVSDGSHDAPGYQSVSVVPARPEEAEIIGTSTEFYVFPGRRTIDATTTIAGGRATIQGAVHVLDVEGLEAALAADGVIWDADRRGDPVGGTTVTVEFIELIPVTTQTGTEYDFIEKRVVPIFSSEIREEPAGTEQVRTAADGTFRASIAATAGHDYEIRVRVTDPDGHPVSTVRFAAAEVWRLGNDPYPMLRATGVATDVAEPVYGIGDPVDLTMSDPRSGGGDTYLFLLAQRGLREAVVQPSARFVTAFPEWAVPNATAISVRFDGERYTQAATTEIRFRTEDRRLTIGLEIDQPRYAPGDDVTIGVTTRTADGRPAPATVVLRAIDEKLYAIGSAITADPLQGLYTSVASGVLSTYGSHRDPRPQPEGRDTTGGGGDDGRSDFRDTLLFRTIETGADGQGSASFPLSDDLTSWRISAAGLTTGLEAGQSTIQVPVGLPFFAEATIAAEYLVSDRPTILVRTFGAELEAGTPVTVQVTAESLGLRGEPVAAEAFETVAVPLPALALGTHELTITATTGGGSAARSDRLVRTFRVIESRLTAGRSTFQELAGPTRPTTAGTGLTTIVLSDAGAARSLPGLLDLAQASGGAARLDRGLAAALATELLEARFGAVLDDLGGDLATEFAIDTYEAPGGGLALLPYASPSLSLSAIAAIVAPGRTNADLADYLTVVSESELESDAGTRERQLIALAGLAGLGGSVLPELSAAAADPDLTIRERLWVGLGLATLGDQATGRTILADLLASDGEAIGEQIRLKLGSDLDDTVEASALAGLLGAVVGDPRADGLWAYVRANPSTTDLFVLHEVGAIAARLARTPSVAAGVAWTLEGDRHEAAIEPGGSVRLSLTPAQVADLVVEPTSGSVGMAVSSREPFDPADLGTGPSLTISRSIEPAGQIGSDDLVLVTLRVRFGSLATSQCLPVVDVVPSGLKPVGSLSAWLDDGGELLPGNLDSPIARTGQRVEFCAAGRDGAREASLLYAARVVTPGTYTWEPALIQSTSAAGEGAATEPLTITIR